MKKIFFTIIIITSSIFNINAQQKDNSSWRIIKGVDEFGDPASYNDQIFSVLSNTSYTKGYSNKKYLEIGMSFNDKTIGIYLGEDSEKAPILTNKKFGLIFIKGEDNIISPIPCYELSNGILIIDEKPQIERVKGLIKSNAILKCYYPNDEYKFNFSIERKDFFMQTLKLKF